MSKSLVLFMVIGSFIILYLLTPLVISIVVGAPRILDIVDDHEALQAISLSLIASLIAGSILVLTGTPLAYILARAPTGKIAEIIESIINVPLAIPHSVAGIMILLAYGSRTPLGSILEDLGIVLEDNFWGIVAAMTFVSAPIYISTLKSGFSMIDPGLEHVARTLGASQLRVFLTITLPLAYKHLIAGYILAIARSISEVGAIMIIAYYPKTAAILIIERFLTAGLKPVLALTTALIMISIALFILLKLVMRGTSK